MLLLMQDISVRPVGFWCKYGASIAGPALVQRFLLMILSVQTA
jgi:hypothetical protein